MGLVGLSIIIATFIISYRGFKDQFFFSKYEFEVEKVMIYNDYKRLITSGFIHVNWMHLIFNLIALYFFSASLELYVGPIEFLLLYMVGIVGGNMLSLLVHKNNSSYTSVGASGAVFSIIFGSIALFPGMQLGLFFLPISFPGWLFGLGYVLLSIYGIKSRTSNIGHDAHLGGALTGMLVALVLHPSALLNNLTTILIIALPAIAFIIFIMKKPEALLIDSFYFKKKHSYTVEDKYNLSKRSKQEELDKLLEKIHNKGMSSLSDKEKKFLKEYSK